MTPYNTARRRWITVGVGGVATSLLMPRDVLFASSNDSFQRHASAKDGFFANTYLYEGDHECVLIDAHLTEHQAQSVVRRIDAIDKPLAAIVVTHPHPDHYLGLEIIGPKFPNVEVVSTARSLDVISDGAAGWRGFHNELRSLDTGPVNFGMIEFDCLCPQDAESIAPLVLFDPETRTLVAGDHVLHGQHLWLVENRIAAWRGNLELIQRTWDIETVLPGHDSVGSADLIAQTDAYLARFETLKTAKASVQEAKSQMLNAYPDHKFTEALDFSLQVHFT